MKRFAVFVVLIALFLSCKPGSSCTGDACRIGISLNPASITVFQGNNATSTVTLTSDSGFTGAVDLSLKDLPSGLTSSFSPANVSMNGSTGVSSTLTITAASTALVAGPLSVKVVATGNGVTDTKPLTITVGDSSKPVAVKGKILRFDGVALQGVNVQIDGPDGATQTLVTKADGTFEAPKVLTPYTVSAFLPGTTPQFRPVTWNGITRGDPQIVMPSLQTGWIQTCTREKATITGGINTAIPSGNAGYVIFMARGISRNDFAFDDPGFTYEVARTDPTSYSLEITFDRGACLTETTGTLLYLEKDAAGKHVRAQLLKAVKVITGNITNQNLTPVLVGTQELSVKLNAPAGTPRTSFYPTPRIDGITVHCCGSESSDLNLLAASKAVDPGGTTTFELPVIPGLEYRMHVHGSPYPTQTGAYWSESASGNASVELSLLNLIGPISPTGTLSGAPPFTPTFTFNPVSGATLYKVSITNSYGVVIWTGHTTGTSIKLPKLGALATLTSGKNTWSVDAIAVRDNPKVDELLDGRMVRKNWDFSQSHYYPDDLVGVSYNYQGTPFTVPSSAPTPPTPPPAPTISVSPKTTEATADGASKDFTATVANTTGLVKWSLDPSSGAGTLTKTSGLTTAYKPPADIANETLVKLKAIVEGTTLSETATITLKPKFNLSVEPKTLSVLTGGPENTFTAATNVSGTITWNLVGPGELNTSDWTGQTVGYKPPVSSGGAATATLTASIDSLGSSADITISAGPTITPKPITIQAGNDPVTFAIQNSDTANWSLSDPALGSLSPLQGASTSYTPPVIVENDTEVQLNAGGTLSGQGWTDLSTITITKNVDGLTCRDVGITSSNSLRYVPPTCIVPVGSTIKVFEYDSYHPFRQASGNWQYVTVGSDPGNYTTLTFSQPGEYHYYCYNHGYPDGRGHAGIIIVK